MLYLTLISLAIAFSVLAGVRFYSRQVNIPVGDQGKLYVSEFSEMFIETT